MKILVVDDNTVTRLLLTAVLEARGHQVVGQAEDMDGCLKLYGTHEPDLVTLDLSLARDDGLTVLGALRRTHAGAKVVIISGNSQKKVRDMAAAAGASGYLEKPFSEDELVAAVERAFSA